MRDPGRTIPRAIVLSAVLVCVLFVALHLAMLGTVSWREATARRRVNGSLPADFMGRIHGPWAVRLITVLLIGSCFGSAFAGLLGYSRIPYGAARAGHFFEVVAHVHPRHLIPHVSLLLVGALTLLWSFFDLQMVISALITTRILVQFVAQIVGLFLLRRAHPEWARPFRIWLAPLPCGLALAGWLYVFAASGWKFVVPSLLHAVGGSRCFSSLVAAHSHLAFFARQGVSSARVRPRRMAYAGTAGVAMIAERTAVARKSIPPAGLDLEEMD